MGSVLEKASAFSLYSFGIILGNKIKLLVDTL